MGFGNMLLYILHIALHTKLGGTGWIPSQGRNVIVINVYIYGFIIWGIGICVWVLMGHVTCVAVRGQLTEIQFIFYQMDHRDSTQVVRLGCKNLYLLSLLVSQSIII